MRLANYLAGATIVAASCFLAGCHQDGTGSPAASAQAGSTAKLGDLSSFKTIAVDTRALVDKGDMDGAKKRIKDLETHWDESEAGLKPRAAADWHTVDKAVDGALTAVRATPANAADAKRALDAAIAAMDRAAAP